MRVVVVENTDKNLIQLTDSIHALLPNALVKGFTNGELAEKWCDEHSADVDIFFGNWFGTKEDYETPEGSNVWKYVKWQKKPLVICTGDEEIFSSWTQREGGDSYINRPVTVQKLRDVLEKFDV